MDFILIIVVSFLASFLTLFSGFGLGTLLLPAFALFIPAELAVAATAMVHGANNVLKAILLGKMADFRIVFRFGLPAIASASLGALLLTALSGLPVLLTYDFLGREAQITGLKLVLGVLILGFAVLELHPKFEKISFAPKYFPVGGLLSGFFGGLSGHQGALRSAFLAKAGLNPKVFVGTNAVIGLLVDCVRLSVYGTLFTGWNFRVLSSGAEGKMILAGILAAFSGVLIGKKTLGKVTMKTIQLATGALLCLVGVAIAGGWI